MKNHHRRSRPPWGFVPPFGLRRRIFLALLGAMITAGVVTLCLSSFWPRTTGSIAGIAICAALSLWLASGRLAFRLVRPLNRVVDTVQRFGQGDYSARTGFAPNHRRPDEVGRVAQAIDAMAERIEQQMKEERQLLAFVSHELRTPMARIRVLTDLARAGHATSLDDIDREVSDVDALVSNILARSRLEFGTLSRKPIRLPDAVREALDRAGLSPELLTVSGDRAYDPISVDPTLLHRAIANLIENAQRHATGPTQVEVRATGEAVTVEVLDAGPGFAEADAAARFQAFSAETSPGRGSGLGLGLNLVQRIVLAHGGTVWAANRLNDERGARVGFQLPFTVDAA